MASSLFAHSCMYSERCISFLVHAHGYICPYYNVPHAPLWYNGISKVADQSMSFLHHWFTQICRYTLFSPFHVLYENWGLPFFGRPLFLCLYLHVFARFICKREKPRRIGMHCSRFQRVVRFASLHPVGPSPSSGRLSRASHACVFFTFPPWLCICP